MLNLFADGFLRSVDCLVSLSFGCAAFDSVIQGGFQRAALLSLSAHPGHELEKRIQTTFSYVLGVLLMPCFWVVCIFCFEAFVASCMRVPEGWIELTHLLA